MALYYQLSTQNVLTKFLSVSSITGGNSVNNQQLASTVASLLTSSVIPANLSTQAITASSITASTITSPTISTLVLYASSIIGVTTGGLAVLPSTVSTFSLLTSSFQFSTATGIIINAQQLTVSSILGNTISTIGMTTGTLIATNLFASTATLSTFSTNTINFAGGFGYLTMPDIYPNTVFTSTVTTSNLLVGVNSVVSPIQFYGFGNYTNSVVAELSTGGTTQELVMFRGSNATDRIRFQTTGSVVFEPGVSARVWPTVPSNVTPAMIINTSSNVGIQTASPGATLDVAGTGRFQNLSTLNISISTINGLTFGAPITSTIIGLGTLGYVSSTQLVSTVAGLGRIYLSTPPVVLSTTGFFTSSVTASSIVTSSLQVNSLLIGTGTGWVNIGPIQTLALSSIQVNANDGYINTLYVGNLSTMNDIAFNGLFGNYNNTVLAEVSTGAGTQEFLVFKGSSASDRVRVQTTGNFVIETGVSSRLFNSNLPQITNSNTTPSFVIDINSNVGIQTATPGATLDVAGTGRFQQVSTLNINVSTINGLTFGGPIRSTVVGLGSAGYISSTQLISTVAGLGQIYLSTGGGGGIATIPANLSTSAFFTSSLLASTGTVFTLSSLQSFTSSATTNAITLGSGAGWISISPVQSIAVSTNTLWSDTTYVNTENVTTGIISTVVTNNLTFGSGGGWLLTSPLQTQIISSIYLFASQPYFDTAFVGTTSTVNTIQYDGLFSNYNNTVLAEISTGAGTQEFLVFKGSSASDRVRVQTTGNFVIETGVSARLWNSNTTQTLSNTTPAFIINTSSNVGIQTASPGATLDVAGTGRFQQVSTFNINLSSINGQTYVPGGLTTGNLQSTVAGLGQLYLSTLPLNLSTSAFFTSSLVASTGTLLTMSSLITNASTVTANLVTASTVATNGINIGINTSWILTAPIQNLALSTNTIWADQSFINTNNVTTEIASTITTNAVTLGTGANWILTSPLQTAILSSIFLYANTPFLDTVNVGSVSTVNSLEYAGLFNNYTNTVLAEISTGAGTQEFLVFKGSSASDRVRVQTTGAFVVETGVSARLFNSNTTQTLSNTTPAFIINTSSNVGIQTANPGATLDVAGTVRGTTISSLALFASSIVAPYVFQPQFFTF